MARPINIEWHEQLTTLEKLYKNEKDVQNRMRLQALWLTRQDRPLTEVAEVVGVHYRTVQEWISWYRQGGLSEVLARHHGGHSGPARRLNAEQEAQLKGKADAGEIRSIADGVSWAIEEHDVRYSYWGMRHVFKRLDLKRKVPRPRNPKASTDEQEAWKKGG